LTLNEGVDKLLGYVGDMSSLLRKYTVLIGDKSRSSRARWDPLGLDITIVARTIIARTIVSHVGDRSRHLGAEVVRFNHHRARVVDILRSRRRRIELARLLLLRVIRSRGGRL
jgi:hypothetical protein